MGQKWPSLTSNDTCFNLILIDLPILLRSTAITYVNNPTKELPPGLSYLQAGASTLDGNRVYLLCMKASAVSQYYPGSVHSGDCNQEGSG